MTTREVIKYYGTQKEVGKALGISQEAVSQWGDKPPKGRQYELQYITNGDLKVH